MVITLNFVGIKCLPVFLDRTLTWALEFVDFRLFTHTHLMELIFADFLSSWLS